LRPPHRVLTILEGESLLNDASALLIYRLAVGAVAASHFSFATVAPAFLLGVAGSVATGLALGWLTLAHANLDGPPVAVIAAVLAGATVASVSVIRRAVRADELALVQDL
jgi:CPA1 family monovalent cation:H+ antiporter